MVNVQHPRYPRRNLAPRAVAASIRHAFETLAQTGAAAVAMSRGDLDDVVGGGRSSHKLNFMRARTTASFGFQ